MSKKLEKMIAEGEHQQQDFKYAITDSRKIAKSLVAFANTDGGRLLIGVKDNGAIAGVSSDEEYYMIEAASEMYCKPPVPFTFERHETKTNKTVLEIRILKSKSGPHFAQDEHGNWIAYLRSEDQNIAANNVQVKVWQKQRDVRPTVVQYTDSERILLDYLSQNQEITLSKFARIAKIPFKTAESILVQLIVWEVLRMEFTDEGVVYKIKPKREA